MTTYQVGALRVRVVEDGALRMDPHRFFAEAPRAALHEQRALDQDGQLRFAVQCLLVQSGERVAILDTGLGLSEESPSTAIVFGQRGRLLPELARLGIRPEQVDAVVMSHAHTDHLGGNVVDGQPVFPNARHFVGAADFQHFQSDPLRSAFVNAQLVPLKERGLLELTEGEVEVLPGLRLLPSPGHTPGHVCVALTSGGEFGLYVGDLIHHAVEVDEPDWSPLIDWMPVHSARERRRILERARRERALVFTAHFPFPGVGRIADGWSAVGW